MDARRSRVLCASRGIAGVAALATLLLGCGTPVTTGGMNGPAAGGDRGTASGKRCVVNLHGKGGDGRRTRVVGGVTYLAPEGNGDGDGWGPHHWEYADPHAYSAALETVRAAADEESCGQVVLTGFSNGGALAAKIYCSGENLGGRLAGVIADDPVPDQAVGDCAPAVGMPVRLIQSGDMASWTGDGMPCPDSWTCQGNLFGPDTYRARLGATDELRTRSHEPSESRYPEYFDSWWSN